MARLRGRKWFGRRRGICPMTERLCFWNRRGLARTPWSSCLIGSDERGRGDTFRGSGARPRGWPSEETGVAGADHLARAGRGRRGGLLVPEAPARGKEPRVCFHGFAGNK